MSESEKPKVFRMNDCDYYMAFTQSLAVEKARDDYGIRVGDTLGQEMFEDCREMTKEEMDEHNYVDDMDNPQSSRRTFAEELQRRIDEGDTSPQLFASTEH